MTMEWKSIKQVIQRFQEMALQKFQKFELTQTSELTKQKEAFKYELSETESVMKKIWQDLSEAINKIYDKIDKKKNLYKILVNQNPAEQSYKDLEKLVSIVVGEKKLNEWNELKNSYLMELEQAKNWLDKEIKVFLEKSNEGKKKIQSIIIKIESNLDDDDGEVYEKQDDLYEMFAQINDVDESILKGIINIQRKEKKLDILKANIKQYEPLANQQQTISDVKKKIKKIINVLQNIQDHPFSQNDFSTDSYEKILSRKQQEIRKYMIFLFFQSNAHPQITNQFKVDLIQYKIYNLLKNFKLLGKVQKALVGLIRAYRARNFWTRKIQLQNPKKKFEKVYQID